MDEIIKCQIENNLTHPTNGKIIDLSQEKMHRLDYEWLAKVIQQASFLEMITLPDISPHEAESITTLLEVATRNNSTLTSMNFDFTYSTQVMPEAIQLRIQQIKRRLERNRKQIFAIHGGGNIGLGLMADIISRSPYQYEIIATSNNQLIRNLINSVNKLWLQHGSVEDNETTCIENVRMVSRERNDLLQLYSEACLAALCITPTVMPSVANDIAHALIKRFEYDGSGIKILVLMNIPNCAEFVFEKVANELLLITQNESYAHQILAGVSFIPTVIDRIVTPIPQEQIKSQLIAQTPKTQAESAITNIVQSGANCELQFNLFNAEKLFSMHVKDNIPEAYRFPDINITTDLAQVETIKNKYINGPHAILAWLGALLGCTTIAEAIENPMIYSFIKEMMENEIGPILSSEYPQITAEELSSLENAFFERCLASKDDPVTRVGRDLLRKLDSGGRIRGTLELAEKHCLSIPTPRLEQGLAAGFFYGVKQIDPTNPGCQKIREIYKRNNKSFSAVLCYVENAANQRFSGLNPKKDKVLINRVLKKMALINEWWQGNSNKASSAPIFLHDQGKKDLHAYKRNNQINGTRKTTGLPLKYNYAESSSLLEKENRQVNNTSKFATQAQRANRR